MRNDVNIQRFITRLAMFQGEHVFNPWWDYAVALDISPNAPAIRRQQLADYFQPRLGHSPYIIVAEAVGYQGGRFSGIAITCERMLLGEHPKVKKEDIFASDIEGQRTSNPSCELLNNKQQEVGFNEPTDTVVWGAILENHLNPYDFLLWNIFPFHPHKLGNPLSNRTPTQTELDLGWEFTRDLLQVHGDAKILAVGQKAAQTMAYYGVDAVALRHPANGGASLYREGFKRALGLL